MHKFRIAMLASSALLVAVASTSAWAQSKSEIQRMQPYLGVLAPDCSNYMLPQLKHLGDSLVVQDGGKAVLTGRNVKPVPKHFGASPPPEFETAFTSEVAGGEALVFVYYRSASGLFAAVEGGPKVMAALPAAFKGKRARHCDPNRNAVPGAGVPDAQAKADPNKFKGYALTELGASGLLYNPKAKATYYKALGPLTKESWLAKLDGPSSENKAIKVAGADFVLIATCKNHDCFENNVVLLFSGPQDVVYGKVYQRGKSTLIGSPPPAVVTELEKLWKSEFRRQQK
ncbi:MAG: Ivy family c-type lysozyme inhibitor [Pseudomonadota bacterium]